MVEDERHFVTTCSETLSNRRILYDKISQIDGSFNELNDNDKLLYLFTSKDRTILTWFGKFLYNSFREKNKKVPDKG